MRPSLPEAYFWVSQALFIVFCLLLALAITGLVVMLVRFLLVATRAAQIYVAKNEPPSPFNPPGAPPAAEYPTSVAAEPKPPEPRHPDPPTTSPIG